MFPQDFLVAFDKMSSNGYADGELEEGPSNWIGATCEKRKISDPNRPNKYKYVWYCDP